jgi:hypothetical protein
MSTLNSKVSDFQKIVTKYMRSRARWIASEHRARFADVRRAFETAFDSGMYRSLSELGDHFGVDRETARRIIQGMIKEVGKERILLLAREQGILENPRTKLNYLLTELLPECELLKDVEVSLDKVEELVDAIGRLDWEQYESQEYTNWKAVQADRFPNHTSAEIDAAAFWLAFRPCLPGYRNFLIRLANRFLTPIEAKQFRFDTQMVECLRNSARWIYHKHARELQDLSSLDGSEVMLNYMWDDLQERCVQANADGEDVVIGLLNEYGLDLDDLLKLTIGELLEKSKRICCVTDKFLPVPIQAVKGSCI